MGLLGGLTREKLIAEMDEKLRLPGVTNIWTQPIINRIDMLTMGICSQFGIKIFGNDLKTLEDLSRRIAEVVKTVPGSVDVYPEQISGAPYMDIRINRTAAARYGIESGTIQDAIEKGIGETNLTVTIEGRRRFPVRVRYAPQFRGSPEALSQIPITSPTGAPIPLRTGRYTNGPGSVNDFERERTASRHGPLECQRTRRGQLC